MEYQWIRRPIKACLIALVATSLALPTASLRTVEAAEPVATGAVKTLTRNLEPVTVKGSSLAAFAGAPVEQIFVYAFDGANWLQIPSQLDEVNASTGRYVPSEGNGLDANDEVVFMGGDTGQQAPAALDLADELPIDSIWYEITVNDPVNSTQGWAYIVRSSTLTKTNTTDYVNFENSIGRLTGQNYALGLTTRPWVDYLTLGGSTVDLLDRNKIRIECFSLLPGICPATEEVGGDSFTIPFGLIKDGNVRVILRDGRGLGYGSMVAWSTVTPLGLLTNSIRVSFDFSPEANGSTLYNAAVPGGVLVDGANDTVPASPVSPWFQLSTGTGAIIQVADVVALGGTPQLSNFYEDDSVSDPTDTGDKLRYGETGILAQYVPGIVLPNLTYNFNLYALSGANPDNNGAAYQSYFEKPLTATSTKVGGSDIYMPKLIRPK